MFLSSSSVYSFYLSIIWLTLLYNDNNHVALSFHVNPRIIRQILPSIQTPEDSGSYFCREQYSTLTCLQSLDHHYIIQQSTPTTSTTRLYEGLSSSTEQQQQDQPVVTASGQERSDIINRVREKINVSKNSNNDEMNGVHENGVSSSASINNNDINNNSNMPKISMNTIPQSLLDMSEEDVPLPTANGGFSHTRASRAKIGAANKGKTPWNKGRKRTEEEKAKIAAGVRARNRERFLQKIKDMGLTEEEYEAQKKEEKRKREAERRARRTEKGGLRPTAETKAKISRILKEKHAKGEIKPRKVDPSKVRRGFTHTAETRAKISASLRNLWANDPEYRAKMLENNMSIPSATKEDTKRKISEALKKKWQDPEFRNEMMSKMSTRKSSNNYDQSYREKISIAMKKKWQDEEYRSKTLKSIKTRAEVARKNRPPGTNNIKTKKRKQPSRVKGDDLVMATPLQSSDNRPKKKKKVVVKRKIKGTATTTDLSERGNDIMNRDEIGQISSAPSSGNAQTETTKKKKASVAKKKKKKKKKEPDGSVNRLREERRDLFELLYGDDPSHPLLNEEGDEDDDHDGDNYDDEENDDSGDFQPISTRFGLDDEDLESFDPYGLDDY